MIKKLQIYERPWNPALNDSKADEEKIGLTRGVYPWGP